MDLAANTALLIPALAGFLSFAWSVVGHFDASGEVDRTRYTVLRVGSVVTWLVALQAILVLAAPLWWVFVPGVLASTAALVLFWWASHYSGRRNLRLVFSEVPPGELFTGGPYNLVRHPFYSAYVLAYAAVAVATLSPLVAACTLFMFLVYRDAALKEEAFFLDGPLAPAYRAYGARTGRFVPGIGTLDSAPPHEGAR